MEVFSKYFRRLVSGNVSQIFSAEFSKNPDNAGNYPILVEEMRKIIRDPAQALKIAESIDGGDSEVFRDFDLVRFIQHFRLNPIAQCLLAIAFLDSKNDLAIKGLPMLDFTFRMLTFLQLSSSS